MARKFHTPIDLQQLEALRLRLEQRVGDPTSGVEGQMYWHTGTDKVRVCSATGSPGTWVDVLVGPITSADILDGAILNIDVNAAAAIAYGKLALANSILGSDIAAGAAIPYTKLSLANSITNNDLAGSISPTKITPDIRDRAQHTGTQLASSISNFDTQVRTSSLNQMVAPTAPLAMGSQRLTAVADPSGAQDAATKNYVDNAIQGLDALQSVRVASTATVTLTAPGTAIDGITLATGDRVLLKNQTAPAENGVYIFQGSASTMTRAPDNDTWVEMPSAFVWVEQGTVNADTGWVNTSDQGGTLGTTAVTWTQFSSAGTAIAGAGLTKTGNTIDAVGTANRITVAADSIDISTAYVGQATITTLGTIATGVWNGSAVPVANGGTGATTAAVARTNLAVPGRYDNGAVHGAGATITIAAATHALGSGRSKMVQVIEEATGDVVETDVNVAANGDVLITFAVAQSANTHRVLILGF